MKTDSKAKNTNLKTVTVRFTPDQLLRLGDAAAIIGNGVTVEELIVAGTMHGIDCEADVLEDAIEGTLSCVENYARQRRTVPNVKRTRHPLGCMTRWQLQAEQQRWAQEHPGKITPASATIDPDIGTPVTVTFPSNLSAAIRFSAHVNNQAPAAYVVAQMAEVEDDVAGAWFQGDKNAQAWLMEKEEVKEAPPATVSA